jgi:hypothetical protein
LTLSRRIFKFTSVSIYASSVWLYYVNPPTPKTPPTRHIREQNLEPLLGPFHGHAAVRLADGELVDDVLLLGLHLP